MRAEKFLEGRAGLVHGGSVVGGRERTEHARKGANKTNHVIGGLMTSYLIQDLSGFSPQIGRLVVMMSYARTTTLEAVKGLTREQLDHLHDQESNSIGALLAHIAAVEFVYQLYTFEDRELNSDERRRWSAALDLGDKARREIRNQPLAHYIALLEEVRTRTLNEFSRRTDEWLYEQALWGKAIVEQLLQVVPRVRRRNQSPRADPLVSQAPAGD